MKRVSIIGTSGSGKTTVGRAVASRLGVPFVELDSLFHRPGWTESPNDEFRADIRSAVAGDSWVIDGNYNSRGARDLIWPRATAVVWLDYAKTQVMWQVVTRSFARAITRRELWAGNREQSQLVRPWASDSVVLESLCAATGAR